MKSTIEKLEGLQCRLKVSVPKEQVESTYRKHLEEEASNAHIKGFRPGKVPLNEIERRVGKSIQQRAIGELMQSSFEEAVKTHKLNVAGQPRIEPKRVIFGEPLEYEAVFETFPDVEIKELKDVPVEKMIAEVAADDVLRMIDKLREQHSDWVKVSRPAQNNDQVHIDFEGSIDNTPIKHGSAKGVNLVLGSKQMIPGFEDGIIGMKENESKDVHVTFPKEYQEASIAGKEAIFKITVHEIQEPKPLSDEELAKKLGAEGGFEGLKKEVRKQMEMSLTQALDARLRSNVLEKLLELNPITIPHSLVESEIRYLQHINKTQHEMMQKRYGKEIPAPEIPKETYTKEAEKRVRLGLLLAEIIKRHQIHSDAEKVHARVNDLASQSPNPDAVKKSYYQNKELMAEVEAAVLEGQVVDKLLETAKVEFKAVSYDDVMKG